MKKYMYIRIIDSLACRSLYIISLLPLLFLCSYKWTLLLGPRYAFFCGVLLFALVLIACVFAFRKWVAGNDEKKITFISVTGAFACTYGYSLYFPAEKSLIWFFLYFFTVLFLRSALPKQTKLSTNIVSGILGGLFALFVFVGEQLERTGFLEMFYILDNPYTVILRLSYFFGQAFLFYVLLTAVFSWLLEREFSCVHEWKHGSKTNVLLLLCMMAGMIILWMPYYYAFFPGTLSSDSLDELRSILGVSALSNHHPMMHQILIALCLKIGGSSLETGVAAYTLVQMVLLALSFALCVYFLLRRGVSKYICGVAYCFFALYPVNAFYSVAMWKDVLHGAVNLVLMGLLIWESSTTQRGKRDSCISFGILVILSFLFCTLRNNGWHAYVLGFPLFVLCNRNSWKRLCSAFVTVVILVSGYNYLLFDVIGVEKSGAGEMLSVPLQQIARTVKYNPELLESEEAPVLKEIFPDLENLGNKYDPTLSDSVKAPATFMSDEFEKDPVKYMKAWARIGVRYPLNYVEAFLMQSYGYWYPDVTYTIVNSGISSNEFGLTHKSDRETLRSELVKSYYELSKLRPVSIIFSLGLMVWLTIIAAALLCLKGQGRLASPLWIMAMLWLTTLASPVYCEYRYLYGLVVSVPLFLGLALGVRTEAK